MLRQNHLNAWTQDERTLTLQSQTAMCPGDPDDEFMQLSMREAPIYTQNSMTTASMAGPNRLKQLASQAD